MTWCLFCRCSEEMVWQAESGNHRCKIGKKGGSAAESRCRDQPKGSVQDLWELQFTIFPFAQMPLKTRLQLPEAQGVLASTPVPSQERTAPVLMLERATEPHAFGVLPGARGLCTLDQTPGAALSQQERKDICLQ